MRFMGPPLTPGAVPSTLSPGTRFGAYEILEQLGAGGMGEVYRARDTRLGREVAIKTVSLRHHSQAGALTRFEMEARSASALNHPNIVTIYELGCAENTHFIAMELVRGETVRELLASGPIPFRKAIAIAAQVADALARAHEIGVVHRDLKPDNLMVSVDGTAKVLDFGLAELLAVDHPLDSDGSTSAGPITEDGAVMGTLSYMSPEQANGAKLDFRSGRCSTRWSPEFLCFRRKPLRRPWLPSFATSQSALVVPECFRRPLRSFGSWSAVLPRTRSNGTHPPGIWLATSRPCAIGSPMRPPTIRSLAPATSRCRVPLSSDASTRRPRYASSWAGMMCGL